MSNRNVALNALRVFEAASRHLSFTKAAEELNVTQAAVSQQIRTLEKQLGLQLFVREKRSLSLTSAGRELARETADAIHRLQETIDKLTGFDSNSPLKITTLPSFGSRWLIPRLAGFQQHHSDIQLVVQTVDEKVDLFGPETDAAIRWNPGEETGLIAEPLMDEASCLVCAPVLAEELARAPEKLQNQTVIIDSNQMRGKNGSALAPLSTEYLACELKLDHSKLRVLSFTQGDNVVVSALAGQGVALTRHALCADAIQEGDLVLLSDFFKPLGTGYGLVYPESRSRDHRLEAFRRWLFNEAKMFCENSPAGMTVAHHSLPLS